MKQLATKFNENVTYTLWRIEAHENPPPAVCYWWMESLDKANGWDQDGVLRDFERRSFSDYTNNKHHVPRESRVRYYLLREESNEFGPISP